MFSRASRCEPMLKGMQFAEGSLKVKAPLLFLHFANVQKTAQRVRHRHGLHLAGQASEPAHGVGKPHPLGGILR